MKRSYDEKIKICQKLGADKFQKVVFKAETLKYRFIKKFLPNYIKWCDKACDRARKKELKKAKTPEERKRIINHYRNQKMIIRKEYNREQNRNYHMDPSKPTEIMHYLNWNKSVHKKGMIRNIGFLSAIGVGAILGLSPIIVIPMAALELGSLFINFQCVNIQNCNIYRLKKNEQVIKKIEEQRTKKNIERYKDAAEAVYRTMEQTEEIPTMTQIIEGVQSKEELLQLRALIEKTLKANQTATKNKVAVKEGGK